VRPNGVHWSILVSYFWIETIKTRSQAQIVLTEKSTRVNRSSPTFVDTPSVELIHHGKDHWALQGLSCFVVEVRPVWRLQTSVAPEELDVWATIATTSYGAFQQFEFNTDSCWLCGTHSQDVFVSHPVCPSVCLFRACSWIKNENEKLFRKHEIDRIKVAHVNVTRWRVLMSNNVRSTSQVTGSTYFWLFVCAFWT